MKRLSSVALPALLLIALHCVSGTKVLAQASLEECQQIYQNFLKARTGPGVAEWTAAIRIGREFQEKCKALTGQDEVKAYVAAQIPRLEERIAQRKIADMEARFNAELKANNADGIISSAKDLISINRPYSLDLILDIASIGYDKASADPPVDKYNADALLYAKMALQKISDGGKSGNEDKYGYYAEYKTKDCPDGKVNATGWMNYTIGFIMYNRQKQSREALPFLYKATQVGCETRGFSEAYRMIGAWHIDEVIRLNTSYEERRKVNGDKEDSETLAIQALQRGSADRAIDAYARAYRVASVNPKAAQTYKDGLLKKLRELFGFRYDGDVSKVDDYLAQVLNRPFPDPTTPVVPVPVK